MNHNNLILSIGSLFGAAASWLLHLAMNSKVMGFLAFIAVVVSIIAGIMTIAERRKSMRMMDGRNRDDYYTWRKKRNKSGGRL